MKSDSCSAMLPGVLASHWQNGRRDMRWVSESGVLNYTTAVLSLSILVGSPAATCRAGGSAKADRSRPVGTMSDLMVKIIYPASDAIFYITTRKPSTDAEWIELQGKALMVAESANLLMMPGRTCATRSGGWLTRN